MIDDLKTKLDAYAEGKLDPEATMEIDGLITRYLDDQLDEVTARKIAAAVEANRQLASIISENAEGKRWLEEECFPAMREAEIELPAKLRENVRKLIADPDAWAPDPGEVVEPKVVPLQASEAINRPPWWLLAASVGGLALLSGLVIFDLHGDRQELAANVNNLTLTSDLQQVRIEELTEVQRSQARALRIAETTLAERELALTEAIEQADRLLIEQEELERQLAVLGNDAAVAAERAEQRQRQLTADIQELSKKLAAAEDARLLATEKLTAAGDSLAQLEADRDKLERQLAAAVRDASDASRQAASQQAALSDEIEGLESQLAAATFAHEAAEADLINAKQTVAELADERERLADEVKELDQELQQVAEADASRQAAIDTEFKRLFAELEATVIAKTAAEAELAQAEGAVSRLQTSSIQLSRDAEALKSELATTEEQLASLTESTSWLNQVAGYHRGYAGGMKEVEFNAEQIGPLLTWLSRNLGHAVTVPDLTEYDLRFIGGRLFFVNGMPVAQIAYHDRLGRLTAFCFSPNPEGTEQDLAERHVGGSLNLIDWKDEAYRYVLVGFDSADRLRPAAEDLAQTYRL